MRAPSWRSECMPRVTARRLMLFESVFCDDQRAQLVVEHHQLEDADAPVVAGVVAAVAALGPIGLDRLRAAHAELGQLGGGRREGLAALGAEHADEPLREHGDQRRRDQVRLDAHVDEARDRGRRVVRVERREHQVTGERRLDRDLRGLEVADLAHQHHVRVLAQHRAQRAGEGEADLVVDLDLADAGQLDLHRVVDRDDVLVGACSASRARRRAWSSCRCRSGRSRARCRWAARSASPRPGAGAG